ncbi:MAG: hypothetical protein GKR89_20795 [Candidatus Latescibacteria bacterium]|nr:hypothetical protein [Candidatus Latescibacterota bacterium]
MVAFLWGGVAAAEEGAATAVVEIGHVPADSLAVPSPVGALMRSVVLPGWGQYYNGRPYKAVMFGGAAAGFAATAVGEMGGPAGETLQEIDDRAARRNTRFLYLIGAVTFAALDAFVDAHLADVEIEPIVGMDGEAALLQVRWHW